MWFGDMRGVVWVAWIAAAVTAAAATPLEPEVPATRGERKNLATYACRLPACLIVLALTNVACATAQFTQ